VRIAVNLLVYCLAACTAGAPSGKAADDTWADLNNFPM
jgi:hypothetical protein